MKLKPIEQHKESSTNDGVFTVVKMENLNSETNIDEPILKTAPQEQFLYETFECPPAVCTWENCNKIYKSKTGLQYHMRMHKNEKPFECSLCGKFFRAKACLKRHTAIHNLQNNPTDKFSPQPSEKHSVVCTWKNCSKTFPHTNGLQYHMRKHKNEEAFKCLSCSKCFQTKSCLRRHLVIHDPNTTSKIFTCQICNREYIRKRSLKIHMRIHTGKNLHKCSQCGKEFTVARDLRNHLEVHARQNLKRSAFDSKKTAKENQSINELENTKVEINLVEKTYKEIETRKDKEDKQGKFACPRKNCYKIYKNHHGLKYHMLRHNKKKRYKCSSCDQSFRVKINLRLHFVAAHDRKRLREFTSQTSGKYPQICTWANCSKILENNSAYQYHMRMHKNEKPFKCSSCSKSFRAKSSLRRHVEIHDPNHTSNVYICQICDRKYVCKSSLTLHMNIHTRTNLHKCLECGKGYTQRRELRKHLASHARKKLEMSAIRSNGTTKTMQNNIINEFKNIVEKPELVQTETDVDFEKNKLEIEDTPPSYFYSEVFVESICKEELIIDD